MSSDSSPPPLLSARRSGRISSQPARLYDKQVSTNVQQQEERELQQALQQSLNFDDTDSTDEDVSPVDLDTEEEEEEKQQPIVQEDRRWTKSIHAIPLGPFVTPFGPVGLRRSHISPLDFFQLFLPLSLIQHVATCTNEYANSKNAVNWTPTNPLELYCFIGLLIYMALTIFLVCLCIGPLSTPICFLLLLCLEIGLNRSSASSMFHHNYNNSRM